MKVVLACGLRREIYMLMRGPYPMMLDLSLPLSQAAIESYVNNNQASLHEVLKFPHKTSLKSVSKVLSPRLQNFITSRIFEVEA